MLQLMGNEPILGLNNFLNDDMSKHQINSSHHLDLTTAISPDLASV
jgi:hypothetical protein